MFIEIDTLPFRQPGWDVARFYSRRNNIDDIFGLFLGFIQGDPYFALYISLFGGRAFGQAYQYHIRLADLSLYFQVPILTRDQFDFIKPHIVTVRYQPLIEFVDILFITGGMA